MGSVIHFVWPGPPEKRAPVKFTAVRTLADGLAEACTKLRLDAGAVQQVTYNKKPVDLSLSFRLANIPASSSLRLEPASPPTTAPPPPKASAPAHAAAPTAAPPPTSAPPPPKASAPAHAAAPTTAPPPTSADAAAPNTATAPTAAPPPASAGVGEISSANSACGARAPSAHPLTAQQQQQQQQPQQQQLHPQVQAQDGPQQKLQQQQAQVQESLQPSSCATVGAAPETTEVALQECHAPQQLQQQQQQQHEYGGVEVCGTVPMEGVEATPPPPLLQQQQQQQQRQQHQEELQQHQQPASVAGVQGGAQQQQQQQQEQRQAAPQAGASAGPPPASGLSRALGLPRETLLLTEDALHQVAASSSSASSIPQAGDDLPDEFFDLTPEDFAILARANEAKRREETAGFKTKAKREQEARAKAEAFASVPVRVRLPGRLVLQAAFAATESLSALHALLQQVLQPGLAPAVYLYTTPPKQVLKDKDASFYQLGLVPAAHVHLGFDEKKMPSGAAAPSQPSDYLLPDALQQVVQTAPPSGSQLQLPGQQTEEEMQREQRRKEDERRQARQNLQGLSGVSVGGASSSRPGGSGSSKDGGPKVPKWLKLQK